MAETNKMYLVTAYKAVNPYRNPHNYVVGLYTDKSRANEEANDHCDYRDGKYHCVVEEINIDLSHEESDLTSTVNIHRGRQ